MASRQILVLIAVVAVSTLLTKAAPLLAKTGDIAQGANAEDITELVDDNNEIEDENGQKVIQEELGEIVTNDVIMDEGIQGGVMDEGIQGGVMDEGIQGGVMDEGIQDDIVEDVTDSGIGGDDNQGGMAGDGNSTTHAIDRSFKSFGDLQKTMDALERTLGDVKGGYAEKLSLTPVV